MKKGFPGPSNAEVFYVYKSPSPFSSIVSCFKRPFATVHTFEWAKQELWRWLHRGLSALQSGNRQEAPAFHTSSLLCLKLSRSLRWRNHSSTSLCVKLGLTNLELCGFDPWRPALGYWFRGRLSMLWMTFMLPTVFCWALSLYSSCLEETEQERERAGSSVHNQTNADHSRERFSGTESGWAFSFLGKHKVKPQCKYYLIFPKRAANKQVLTMSSRTHGQGLKDFELPLLCFPREDLRLEICGFESSFVLLGQCFPTILTLLP